MPNPNPITAREEILLECIRNVVVSAATLKSCGVELPGKHAGHLCIVTRGSMDNCEDILAFYDGVQS